MGTEYQLVEKPSIEMLKSLGYEYLKASENHKDRDGLNHVILRNVFITSIMRINEIDQETASSVYQELLGLSDNEKWTSYLRGNYSRAVPGQSTKKTIHLIDFLNASNNRFTVTSQFKVASQKSRIPDLVCFVNGIPLVVIEAKSPVSFKDKTGEAFDQIKQYEQDIPRLFYSNLFSIITNGQNMLYGATGAKSQYWGYWRDPWPRKDDEFTGELTKGYYSLLEPSRLLDLLAHFVVFEKSDNVVVKKICRYQQFRAVNKIVSRVLEERESGDRKGLVWHTQGSGKSLTMVFAALKLKTHLTVASKRLESPNILILTDRIDLDDQISKTFHGCGIRNPERVDVSIESRDKGDNDEEGPKHEGQISRKGELKKRIHMGLNGLTLLSTVFKFEGSNDPVKGSDNWILLVDECHRTQEKDLGAYLRRTFPESWFFGFTGTPIKKTDKDTYRNFSPEGESYLDKYSIDDAVRDGATVPIKYTSRMVDWQVDPANIDILFDQWFANYSPEQREAIKKKELTYGTLLKHTDRVEKITKDIWEHFKTSAMKDGYKAQLVAYDREAIILYKWALNKLIAEELEKEGLSPEEAMAEAMTYSHPVYSSNQEDAKPAEDEHRDRVREALVDYRLSDGKDGGLTEKEIKKQFKVKGQAPWFLIVCNKLLTGFDAPVESVMYLDNPLKEHNLLQAIARTNRVEGEHKEYGLIVDYVGVTKNLKEALASYRSEDVANALKDLEEVRSELRQAHSDAINLMRDLKRKKEEEYSSKDDYTPEFDAFNKILETEDKWLCFKRKAKRFIKVYGSLSPDPAVLDYKRDLKWVAMYLPHATQYFQQEESVDIKNTSAKIREMLEQELKVTGLHYVVQIREITDPEYWNDFDTDDKPEEELKTAAVRKATELKKTISEKLADNPEQYGPFSERLKAIIQRMNAGQESIAHILKDLEGFSKGLLSEENAHSHSGLTKNAYGIYKIIDAFRLKDERESKPKEKGEDSPSTSGEVTLDQFQEVALEIDQMYQSSDHAPKGWHIKDQMKKELRRKVRHKVAPFRELLHDWKEIPDRVEQFALKHYVSGQ